jgi:hypothetical protein
LSRTYREALIVTTEIPRTTSHPAETVVQPVPANEIDFFGPAPLIPGEDEGAYQALLSRAVTVTDPRDIFEEIWVREVVDLTWEALRLRRLKAYLFRATAYKGVSKVLLPLVPSDSNPPRFYAESIGRKWAIRDKVAVEAVNEYLAEAELTMEHVMAETLSGNLDLFEQIDRLLQSVEARRNTALHEIERHRERFGAALRAAAEDAEFTDVGMKVIVPDSAG